MGDPAAHARSSSPRTDPDVCRCVIWADPADPAVAGLVHGIDSRGAQARPVAAAAEVIVELSRGARVVIVHRPAQRTNMSRLLGAVARYYPKAMLWRFDPDGAGLVKLEQTPRAMGPAGGNGHREQERPQPAPRDAEPLITPEELAMLLGPRET